MGGAVDKYFTPIILDKSLITQEMCYKSILHYCQIIQGKEFPWTELYNSVERADIHSRIAQYCDCDDDVVTKALDKVFPDSASLEDDVFLKNVDKFVEELKDVARLPHKKRYPSLIPEGGLYKIADSIDGIPVMGRGVPNDN